MLDQTNIAEDNKDLVFASEWSLCHTNQATVVTNRCRKHKKLNAVSMTKIWTWHIIELFRRTAT